MKKHLIKILLFLLIIVAIDVLTGLVCSRLTAMARGGDTARNEYICNGTSEEILVMGSSRAIHHYNPAVIDSLTGMSCYNCGQDGNGAILNYGRLHMILQRYRPQVLIYDVMPEYDLLAGDDNRKYLGWLRPYYDHDGIAAIFEAVDPMEKYKMMSRMYRYNSRFVQLLSDCVHPMQSDGLNGFRPLDEEMDTMRVGEKAGMGNAGFDPVKLSFLNKLLDEACGIEVVMVVSPCWNGMDTTVLKPVREMCRERNIPFLDFSNDPKYLHKSAYFADGAHLNARGAEVFSREVVSHIRR